MKRSFNKQDLNVISRLPCARTRRIRIRLDGETVLHAACCLADLAFTLRQGGSDSRPDLYQLPIDELYIEGTLATHSPIQPFNKCPELGYVVQRLAGPRFRRFPLSFCAATRLFKDSTAGTKTPNSPWDVAGPTSSLRI